jgi:hypothetical protein
MFKKVLCFLFALTVCHIAKAQTFDPDKNGHVPDAKFSKLIRSRGYELVGSFDTLQFDPLEVVAPFQKTVNGAVSITMAKWWKNPSLWITRS